MLRAVLHQALVRGDAEADKELCARAMGAVYSAHAAAIGALPPAVAPCAACCVKTRQQSVKEPLKACMAYMTVNQSALERLY